MATQAQLPVTHHSPAQMLLRRFFRLLNKFFMVPMFRLGFGPLMGSPYGGYIMVIRTVGRKTGKTRYTPVNYAILNGCVYCSRVGRDQPLV